MVLSIFLAKYLGLLLAIVSLVFLLNRSGRQAWRHLTESEGGFLLTGLVNLAVGLALVLTHNIWIKSWPVLITIIGWVSLVKGVAYLLVPETSLKQVKSWGSGGLFPFCLVVLLAVSLYLAYIGFMLY